MVHSQGFPTVTPTDDEILALDSSVDWEALAGADARLKRFGQVVREAAHRIRHERALDRTSRA